MKFLIPFAAVLTLSHVASAESIYCTFTEPFISVSYNSDTNKVKVSTPDQGSVELTGKVTFDKGGLIHITSEGLNHKLTVNTTKEGSDGMSDFVYPFEGVINTDQIYGGCETDTLKKTEPTPEPEPQPQPQPQPEPQPQPQPQPEPQPQPNP